jgi:hypothetical protein
MSPPTHASIQLHLKCLARACAYQGKNSATRIIEEWGHK